MLASITKFGTAALYFSDTDLQQLGYSQDPRGNYVVYIQTKSGFTLQMLADAKTQRKPNHRVYKLTRISSRGKDSFFIQIPLKYFAPLVEVGFRYEIDTVTEPGPILNCSVLLESKDHRKPRTPNVKRNASVLDEATKCVKYLNSLVDQQIVQLDLNNGKVRVFIE